MVVTCNSSNLNITNLSDIIYMRVFQACNLLHISPIPEQYLSKLKI